jgi:pimeloyl-ACP methyl ester carboxylesterase
VSGMRSLRCRTAILSAAAVVAVPAASGRGPALTLKPCVVRGIGVVQGIHARCGTFVVPENRAKPNGRRIRLRVVVLPGRSKPVAKDAVTYLAGGPGTGAADKYVGLKQAWPGVNAHHDILLVDERGTGRSNAYSCPKPKKPLTSKAAVRAYTLACLKAFGSDVRQYGTRMAMDDLDAVRAALGYRQLDVFGASYGAVAAQVYLKLHPSSVRTLTLLGRARSTSPSLAAGR